MIQRIQTLFLLLAVLATALVFVFPFATTERAVATSEIFADTAYTPTDNTVLLIFFATVGLLALVDIFLFNNRTRQLLVGRITALLYLIAIILMAVFFMTDSSGLETPGLDDGLGAYAAFAGFIGVALANHFIKKDDKLVRSADRLR